jgi:hypothetical protein
VTFSAVRRQDGQFIRAGDNQFEGSAQDLRAYSWIGGRPAPQCRVSCGQRLHTVFGSRVRHLRDDLAGGGILDRETVRGADPFAVDQQIGREGVDQ